MTSNIGEFDPYEEYKSPSEDWMEKVPSGWDVKRARYCFEELNERSETGEEVLLSLSKYQGLVPRQDLTDEEHRADSLEGYKVCREGDIVMNKMQAWNGMFGLADQKGIVSPDYTVFRPQPNILPEYYLYLLKTPMYVGQFRCRSRGIGTAYLRLHTQHFYDIPLYHPPFEIQQKIVSFLDHHTSQIDSLIERKEDLLDLLEERRQGLITRAVTTGLNSGSEMEDSGIEPFSKIPETWSTTKLKFVTTAIIDSEHNTAPEDPEGDYHIIRTSDVRDGELKLEQTQRTNREVYEEWTKRGTPSYGDLIFTREAPVGEVGMVPNDAEVLLGQRTVLISPDESEITTRFLCYYLQSDVINWYINLTSQGSTVDHLNLSDLRDLPLFLPPKQTQDEIVEQLTSEITRIDSLEEYVTDAISYLKEKRESIINSAVTGQIDVSGWELAREEVVTA